jgi:RNA polymerase sigma-70 factor, ECF subfamily
VVPERAAVTLESARTVTERMPDPPEKRRHDALFAAHHDAVWRYAVRRVGDAGAEDVVAETFLVAWRRIDAVPEHELAWLLGVARKVIANQRRGQRRRANLTERIGRELELGAEEASEPQVPATAVLAALATLGERDQEVLRLIYWDGLAPAQAARVLGCTAVALRVRLHRARARMARALAEGGYRAARLTPTEA